MQAYRAAYDSGIRGHLDGTPERSPHIERPRSSANNRGGSYVRCRAKGNIAHAVELRLLNVLGAVMHEGLFSQAGDNRLAAVLTLP
ncbi:protein of unknown function [Paraburkholderia kururiensis]